MKMQFHLRFLVAIIHFYWSAHDDENTPLKYF